MKIVVFFLIFVVLLSSCKRTQQEEIADIYAEWMGKQIIMPQNPIFTIDAKDTVTVEYKNNYKIVMYVDSIGCLSCHLPLKTWEHFSHTVDSLVGRHVPTLIFVNVTKLRDIGMVLERHDYHRPICIDTKDEFNQLNKFPKYEIFRCFLLDENNKVVLVGNPTQNAKVAELYLKAIKERFGVTGEHSLESVRPVIKMGVFEWREKQQAQYILRNETDSEMRIETVSTSCECTKASIDKEEIAVGDSAVVSIEYQAERAESFMREVYVRTAKEEIVITIEGEGIEQVEEKN